MRRNAFTSIFWGLLFVVLDIRIGSIDLILPDFIGYILLFQGLTALAPDHRSFRTARVLAAVMIVGSLPSLIEVGTDPVDPAFFKRQWIAALTGDLSALLPRQVKSARLLRTTHSRSAIDANRTQNPKQDEDTVLGQYSDGTEVLILRYASPEEALRAFEHKYETEYSLQGLQKRAETDASFRAESMSGSRSTSGPDERRDSEDWSVEAADRLIQQWWNPGWSWWPSNRDHRRGWSSSMLYIVEGYKSTAAAYKSALKGERPDQSGVTFNPLFPVSIIGEILTAMMVWAICSGIIALSRSLNQPDLMTIAHRRRSLSMALTVTGWLFSTTWLIAPEYIPRLVQGTAASLIVLYALLAILAGFLIMTLMRRAANSLG